ncbi:hypothetical protein Pat9b_5267 (plasmid) [Pantoea sp. At-9b]|nr:hypothetical protein Pat9b_5267 [Pantoea sp. At-9b]
MLRRMVTYFVAAITLALPRSGAIYRATPTQSHGTNRFAYLANSPPADYG